MGVVVFGVAFLVVVLLMCFVCEWFGLGDARDS